MTDYTREDMRERIAGTLYGVSSIHAATSYKLADAIMDELGLWEAYEAMEEALRLIQNSRAPGKGPTNAEAMLLLGMTRLRGETDDQA